MTFEEKLMTISKEREARLYKPCDIAMKKPNTGVKILKKSAYHVIKDCATITKKYLPIMIYGNFFNPIAELKEKFLKAEIVDFVNRAERALEVKQFLYIILIDIQKYLNQQTPKVDDKSIEPTEPVEVEVDDVYGDYMIDDDEDYVDIDIKQDFNIELDNKQDIIEKLVSIFTKEGNQPVNNFRK